MSTNSNTQIFPLPNRTDLTELDIELPSREAAQPIGAILVQAGALQQGDVPRILEYQRKSGLLFGAVRAGNGRENKTNAGEELCEGVLRCKAFSH